MLNTILRKLNNCYWAWKNRCKDVKFRHAELWIHLSSESKNTHSKWIERAYIPCKVCGSKYCRWAVNRYTMKSYETI